MTRHEPPGAPGSARPPGRREGVGAPPGVGLRLTGRDAGVVTGHASAQVPPPAGPVGAGSPEAVREAVLANLDSAYNLARWLLRDEHEAQDAVQDACVRALRAPAAAVREPRSWLLTIVRNACYDRLSAVRPRRSLETEGGPHEPSTDAAPDNPTARAVDSERLRAALESLPETFREAIVLRELEGLSYRQIALVIDMPIGTVMSRLSRARELLRRTLGPDTESRHGV